MSERCRACGGTGQGYVQVPHYTWLRMALADCEECRGTGIKLYLEGLR